MDLSAWLAHLCQLLPEVSQALVQKYDSDDAQNISYWPSQFDNAAMRDALQLAKQQSTVVTTGQTSPPVNLESTQTADQQIAETIIAYPIFHQQRLYAVLVVQLQLKAEQQKIVMQLLGWAEGCLQLLLKENNQQSYPLVIALVQQALVCSDKEQRLQQVATFMAKYWQLESVAIGVIDGEKPHLKYLSGGVPIDDADAPVQAIELAMAETYQHNTNVLLQMNQLTEATDFSSHQQLAKQMGNASLYSTVFSAGDEVVGVVLIRAKESAHLSTQTITITNLIASLLAGLMLLGDNEDKQTKSDVSFFERSIFTKFQFLKNKFSLAIISIAILLFVSTMVTGDYRVAAKSYLEGKVQRVIVSPYAGYIESSLARAGEVVSAGDVIAQMQTNELLLEQQRWLSQKNEYIKQYRTALSELNKAQVHIYKSQVAQAEAELGLIKRKLERAKLIAPIDGIIISGDLSRSLGAPVEQGQILYQVAPLDEYRLVIQVEENDIVHIKEKMRGELKLQALNKQKFEFEVTKISPVFEANLDDITYRVEALIINESKDLRPGMQGTAKIKIGQRSYAWIYLHKMVGALRLWFWRLLP